MRKDARNARAIADLKAALRALGFEITGAGKASISARATPETFNAVFGDAPPAASYRERGTLDRELLVPPALAGYVESISVAPRHSKMSPKGRE